MAIKSINFVLLIALASLIGCTHLTADPVPATQGKNIEISEIATLAEVHLETVEDDSDWLSAAVEVAKALHAVGDSRSAKLLLNRALPKAHSIDDAAKRAGALLEVSQAMLEIGDDELVGSALDQIKSAIDNIQTDTKRWDLLAKLAVLYVLHGQAELGLSSVAQIPLSDNTLASFRARALQEIAPIQARQYELGDALETLSLINMGLIYYRATARADVAVIAHNQERNEAAISLLREANDLSYEQADGYFVAGSLRHIAEAYGAIGDKKNAVRYFSEALKSATTAKSPQHQARAISRIATSLADLGLFDKAIAVFPQALQIAESESRDAFRFWAFYEIAGSAAFSGDFSTANKLLQAIPASFKFAENSLISAAQRDVAWGLARHQRQPEALRLALKIGSPRERVQALSRIARVLADARMKALPRYL